MRIENFSNFAKQGKARLGAGKYVTIAPGSDFGMCRVGGALLNVGSVVPFDPEVECVHGFATGPRIVMLDGDTASQAIGANIANVDDVSTPLAASLELCVWECGETPQPCTVRAPRRHVIEFSEIVLASVPMACVARVPFYERKTFRYSFIKGSGAGTPGDLAKVFRTLTYFDRAMCLRMARESALIGPARPATPSPAQEIAPGNYVSPLASATLGASNAPKGDVNAFAGSYLGDELQVYCDDATTDSGAYSAADNWILILEVYGERDR